jgi:hypothetical protein
MQIGNWRILRVVHRRALCQCRCGAVHEVAVGALEDRSSTSCGCAGSRAGSLEAGRARLPDWRPQR